MKQILIISLVVFLIAARHHKDDAVTACVNSYCRPQLTACVQTANCLNQFTNCANSFQQNYDLNEFNNCLDQVPSARTFANCLIQNCLGVESEQISVLLNKLN